MSLIGGAANSFSRRLHIPVRQFIRQTSFSYLQHKIYGFTKGDLKSLTQAMKLRVSASPRLQGLTLMEYALHEDDEQEKVEVTTLIQLFLTYFSFDDHFK